MVLLVVAILIGVAAGFLTGGTFRHLHLLRLRALPLLFAALLVQIAIFSPILGTNDTVQRFGALLHVATLLASLFVMLRNAAIPGMKIVALGAALNALVIMVNGGFMPTDPDAIRAAGLQGDPRYDRVEVPGQEQVLTNTVIDGDAPLLFLGDAIPIPWPAALATVISLGDAVLALGAAVVLVRAMRRKPAFDQAETTPAYDAAGPSASRSAH